MDLKELFKDVTSFNKEAAMKENMRMVELKDSVTAQAFRDAQTKLASYFGDIKIDSPESNLTEFSRNKLSGKMKAMLSVSTTAGLKRLPIHFVVKASVASMVETPEQVIAALENVEGSIDKEVKEILEKQKQMSAYHNEDIEVKADGEKIPAVQYRDMHTAIHHLALFNTRDEALEAFERLKQIQHTEYPEGQEGEDGYIMDMYEAFATSTGDIEVDYRTVQNDPEYDIVNKDWVIDASAKNSNIKVQAKKKEIDLGVRENTSASQFPVKLLVYPKTYLPELKKGDILNVGGFKYRYIGDEPTISGDTENGINARFELVVSTKKASLNVTAADGDEAKEEDKKEDTKKSTLPEDTEQDIEQAAKEKEEALDYLKGLSKEDLSDKEDDDIRLDVMNFIDYNVPIPTNYFKEMGARRPLALWYLSLKSTPITDLEGDVPAGIFKHIKDDPKAAYNVLKSHSTKSFPNFDSLPEFFKDILPKSNDVVVTMIKEHPEWLTDKMADDLISSSPSDAIELGIDFDGTNVKNPAYQKFRDFAKEQGVSNDIKSNEELDLPDGNPEDESVPNVESEDPMDALEEEKEYRKDQSQYGTDLSGLGLDDTLREKRQEEEDEANQNQDITDDGDDEGKKKSKSEVETDINKEADVTDDLTFEEDIHKMATSDNNNNKRFTYDGSIIDDLKAKFPELKNIPNEWIEIVSEDWYGTLKWAIDLDARSWGLSNFAIRCFPTKVTCDVEVSYYASAEAADKDESTENSYTLEYELTEIEPEFNNVLESGSQLFANTLTINDGGTTATVGF